MTDQPKDSVRPMTAADYKDGTPIQTVAISDHPTRDLIIGAVVGAAALWAVPKALDWALNRGLLDIYGEDPDDGDDGLELELEDE